MYNNCKDKYHKKQISLDQRYQHRSRNIHTACSPRWYSGISSTKLRHVSTFVGILKTNGILKVHDLLNTSLSSHTAISRYADWLPKVLYLVVPAGDERWNTWTLSGLIRFLCCRPICNNTTVMITHGIPQKDVSLSVRQTWERGKGAQAERFSKLRKLIFSAATGLCVD